jgi:HEAT repeat protein
MKHIFVSYSHSDSDFVATMINVLEDAGITCWLDKKVLNAGDDWRAQIDQAIKDSIALVVVLTSDATKSQYVTYEWAFALGVGIRVIPLLRETVEMHPRLESLHYLDFREYSGHSWTSLVQSVQDAAHSVFTSSIHVPINAPPAVKQSVNALDSYDPKIREAAIESLSQTNHPTAHQALLDAVQHPIQDVRKMAAMKVSSLFQDKRCVPALIELLRINPQMNASAGKSLAAIRDPEAVPNLIEAMHDSNPAIRSAAQSAVRETKDLTVVPHLLKALDDPDEQVRLVVIEVLHSLNNLSTVPGLISALSDSHLAVRKVAIIALGNLQVKEAIPAINQLINQDSNLDVQIAAIQTLGLIGDADAINIVIDALHSDNKKLRDTAKMAIRNLRGESAIAALIQAITDPNTFVQSTVIETLRSFRDASGVELITEALADTDIKVRRIAVEMLANIEDPIASISGLLVALEDQDNIVRDQASKALQRLTTVEAVQSLSQRFNTRNPSSKEIIIAIMGRIGAAEVTPLLIEASDDPSTTVRKAAVEALARMQDRTALSALIGKLDDSDPNIQQLARKRLAQPDARYYLLKTLQEGSETNRRNVIMLLSNIRTDPIIEAALIDQLSDPSSDLRCCAVEALGMLRAQSALHVLHSLIIDPNQSVGTAAEQAIKRITEASISYSQTKPAPPPSSTAYSYASSTNYSDKSSDNDYYSEDDDYAEDEEDDWDAEDDWEEDDY